MLLGIGESVYGQGTESNWIREDSQVLKVSYFGGNMRKCGQNKIRRYLGR